MRRENRIKRIIGLVLLVIACSWLGFAQVLIWMTPVGLASEAPDRHLPSQETFTKQEAYGLAFALARDIRNRNPNILLPAALLLFASWLFHSSGEPQTPTHRNYETHDSQLPQ